MRPAIFAASLSLFFTSILLAQSPQRLADYLTQNPDADTNGDGVLSIEEAKAHRGMKRNPTTGDNLAARSVIPGAKVSLTDSPIEEVALRSEDGVDLSFVWRKPAGDGPFPAIIFLHGGGNTASMQDLRTSVRSEPVQTRFLENGYLIAASTRRPFWKSRGKDRPFGFDEAVQDTKLILEKIRTLPEVDPNKITLYGGSGGGILAIGTAAVDNEVAAVIAGEPATVIPLDPRSKTGEITGSRDYEALMQDPLPLYTAERREETRAWMNKIECPVLILQGKPVLLYKVNFEILIPEMKALGKDISSITYPGMVHGFYWGKTKTGATLETVEKVVDDSLRFLAR